MLLLGAYATISWHHVHYLEQMVFLCKVREDAVYRSEGILTYAVWRYEHDKVLQTIIAQKKIAQIDIPCTLLTHDATATAEIRVCGESKIVVSIVINRKSAVVYQAEIKTNIKESSDGIRLVPGY